MENSGVNYPERSMPKVTGIKAPGNKQGANDGAPADAMASKPMEGTRPKGSLGDNSEVCYPQRSTPKPEAVRQANMNPAARKKALADWMKSSRVNE